AGDPLLEGPEVAEDGGPPELIIEGGGADGSIEHDLQRGRNPGTPRLRSLPRLGQARDPQVRDREARQPGLRLRAAAGRSLVADLPARAGRGSGERRDRGRMVVGLDLHQDVDRLARVAIRTGRWI